MTPPVTGDASTQPPAMVDRRMNPWVGREREYDRRGQGDPWIHVSSKDR